MLLIKLFCFIRLRNQNGQPSESWTYILAQDWESQSLSLLKHASPWQCDHCLHIEVLFYISTSLISYPIFQQDKGSSFKAIRRNV